MERLNKNEKFWFIDFENMSVTFDFDDYESWSNIKNTLGNYFHTEEQAETMARKVRAVLKGADVIEMSSKEEICNQCQREWVANDGIVGDGRIFNDIVMTAYSIIKSKTVK